MKKIFALLIIFALSFTFFSCTDSKANKRVPGQAETKFEDIQKPKKNVNFKYDYGPESEIVVTESTDIFPAEFKGKYIFSSGVGAWSTELRLSPDGSFTGKYTDSNSGEAGNNYDSTLYVCDFDGKFKIAGNIDEHSYYATVSELSFGDKREVIKDRVRYVYTSPAGLKKGERFVLYTPETPIGILDDDFLFWRYCMTGDGENQSPALDLYGLYNIDSKYGFFSFEY